MRVPRAKIDSVSSAQAEQLADRAGPECEGDNAHGGQEAYKSEFAHIAKTMCAIGATDTDLADAFQVTVAAIAKWRAVHEEFSNSCEVGKECADARVERSLFKRAVGYDYDAEKVFLNRGQAIVTKFRVHVPADVAAAKFWLENRKADTWSRAPKQNVQVNTPLDLLRQQLNGTAIRPKEK